MQPADASDVYTPQIGRYGGTLRMATIADPKRYNPITAQETSSGVVTDYVFEGLTTQDAFTGQAKPLLAESWETNADGTEWTFHLRHDVQWSDGQPFTAEDVLFTLEAIFAPGVANSMRSILTIDDEPVVATAPDPHTVVFHLPAPFAPFDRAAGFSIVPKHILGPALEAGEFGSTWGVDTPPGEVIGTGPFLFTDFQPGQRVILKRNPNYWKKDAAGNRLPYLDRIVFGVVQSTDVLLLKFQQGEIDYHAVRGKDYPLLKPKEREGNFTLYKTGPAFGSIFIYFNQNGRTNPETGKPYLPPHKYGWFSQQQFRQAVAHAIDKSSIIEIVLNGLGYEQWGPMSPSAGYFYNPDVRKYPYDPDRARALLAEIGIKDRNQNGVLEDSEGREIEFTFFTNSGNEERVDTAEIIRKDLERLGMKVHFSQIEFNALLDKMDNSEYDLVLMGLTGGVEPHFGKNVWDSSAQLHMWNPKQPEPATEWEARIDKLFNAGVKELDPEKRKAIYDEWQGIVAEQLPLIYTCLSERIFAVRNRFGNMHPTPLGGAFHNLEEIYVLEAD